MHHLPVCIFCSGKPFRIIPIGLIFFFGLILRGLAEQSGDLVPAGLRGGSLMLMEKRFGLTIFFSKNGLRKRWVRNLMVSKKVSCHQPVVSYTSKRL